MTEGANLSLHVPSGNIAVASDEQLANLKLAVNVQVGGTVFRAGTPLLALVNQHRALYAQLYPKGDLL